MTEEVMNEEVVEAVEEFTGIAGTIADLIGTMKEAREIAVELEAGLTSQAAIRKTSVALRSVLVDVQKGVKEELRNVLAVRKDLAENVGDIQKAAKKAALEAKLAKMQEELAELEG